MGMGARAALFLAVGLVLIAVGSFKRGAPVVLEQESLEQHAKCDAKCSEHKAMVIARMKALRKEIDGDYHAMVHFGDKAGYVPPVRSIKAQVMDGSLLGGGKSDDAAPPPFSADVADGGKSSSSHGGLSASSILPRVGTVGQMQRKFMHKAAQKASAASEGHHHASEGGKKRAVARVRAAAEATHKASHKKAPVVDIFDPSVGPSVKVHDSSHHESRGRRSGKGSKQWNKAFAFMQSKAVKMGRSGHAQHSSGGDRGVPESVERHVRTKKTTEPAVVRAAMQKALSFATSSMHRSKTEEEGDKLLGLDTRGRSHQEAARKSDPLDTKFLNSWFGA